MARDPPEATASRPRGEKPELNQRLLCCGLVLHLQTACAQLKRSGAGRFFAWRTCCISAGRNASLCGVTAAAFAFELLFLDLLQLGELAQRHIGRSSAAFGDPMVVDFRRRRPLGTFCLQEIDNGLLAALFELAALAAPAPASGLGARYRGLTASGAAGTAALHRLNSEPLEQGVDLGDLRREDLTPRLETRNDLFQVPGGVGCSRHADFSINTHESGSGITRVKHAGILFTVRGAKLGGGRTSEAGRSYLPRLQIKSKLRPRTSAQEQTYYKSIVCSTPNLCSYLQGKQ